MAVGAHTPSRFRPARHAAPARALLLVLLLAAPAAALGGPDAPGQAAPRPIGAWDDWAAFTTDEAGATVCYAVARPSFSIPATGRGEPTLTVALWPERRDVVSLSAGPGGAAVELRVGSATFPFDAGPDGAFARDGAAVVAAMARGLQAIARFADARGAQATDTYGLRGFRAAYDAIRRACAADQRAGANSRPRRPLHPRRDAWFGPDQLG